VRFAPGIVIGPVSEPESRPGQKPEVASGKDCVPSVIVLLALFHVEGTVKSLAVIVQVAPITLRTMTRLPVTSTAVVLVAVKVQGTGLVADSIEPGTPVQAEKVGGAAVVPPVSVVKASAPPADLIPE
jgi:hypothetical protein